MSVEDRRRAEPAHGSQWCILHIAANNEKVQNNIHSSPLSWLHCWSYRAAAYHSPFFLTITPSSFSYLTYEYTFISSGQASHLKVTGLTASPLKELDWDQKKLSTQVKEEYKKALNKGNKGDLGRGKDGFNSSITQSNYSALNICHFNPFTAFRT